MSGTAQVMGKIEFKKNIYTIKEFYFTIEY